MKRSEWDGLPRRSTVEADGLVAWLDQSDDSGGPRVVVSPASAFGGGSSQASGISVTDVGGNFAATDVEAALAETADALETHIADAAGAHAASAVSVLDSGGNFTATDVEAALAETADALEAHLADTADAHDASAVSFAPAGGIAATTVQAALQELDTEKAASAHNHTTLLEKVYSVSGTLVAEAGTVRVPFKRAGTITNVYAQVGVAPTGAAILVDVHLNGTTIFTTQGNRPQIAISGFQDMTAVPDVTAVSAGDYLTVDIDQVGSTIAGADLVVGVEYTETIS